MLGHQEPRVGSWPSFVATAGDDAIELGESAGVFLDPWQQLALKCSLAEHPAGGWLTFETAIVVCRQNGKGEITLVRQLFGLFVLGQRRQVHTAHEFKTAADAFARIMEVIESTPDLDRRVGKVSNSHGDEGITLKSGAELRFFARTGGSGRGFFGDTVYFDEAFNVPEAVTRALVPTMLTRADAQLWWTSSSVDQAQHPHGIALARVRRRAIAGTDPRLAYLEWSADEERYRLSGGGIDYARAASDPLAIAEANPSLNQPRPNAPTLQSFADSRGSMSAQGFSVEHLGIGDWPVDEEDVEQLIPADVWARGDVWQAFSAGREDAVMRDPLVLAVETQPGLHGFTSIAVAGWTPGHRPQVELVERARGFDWLVERVTQLVERHDPSAVMIDPSGPAGQYIAPLKSAGIEPVEMTARDTAQAFGLFHGDATSGRLQHLGDQAVSAALRAARTRKLSGALAWDQHGSAEDISALVAITRARYGLELFGKTVTPPPAARAVPAATAVTNDLMTAGF